MIGWWIIGVAVHHLFLLCWPGFPRPFPTSSDPSSLSALSNPIMQSDARTFEMVTKQSPSPSGLFSENSWLFQNLNLTVIKQLIKLRTGHKHTTHYRYDTGSVEECHTECTVSQRSAGAYSFSCANYNRTWRENQEDGELLIKWRKKIPSYSMCPYCPYGKCFCHFRPSGQSGCLYGRARGYIWSAPRMVGYGFIAGTCHKGLGADHSRKLMISAGDHFRILQSWWNC